MPKHTAELLTLGYLGRLDIAEIAHRRNPALTHEERFCVMLLRAAMVQEAMILIDRPFLIVPHLKDVQFLTATLKKIDDLYLSCHIYDYKWTKEKYGDL